MQVKALGERLKSSYERAAPRDKVLAIHIFGIRYADEIGSAATGVVEAAGLSSTYGTEVHKGMRLAKHVRLIEGD